MQNLPLEQASAMEHEGVSGMVHITQQTLDRISVKDRGKLIIKERYDVETSTRSYLVTKKYKDDLALVTVMKTDRRNSIENPVS